MDEMLKMADASFARGDLAACIAQYEAVAALPPKAEVRLVLSQAAQQSRAQWQARLTALLLPDEQFCAAVLGDAELACAALRTDAAARTQAVQAKMEAVSDTEQSINNIMRSQYAMIRENLNDREVLARNEQRGQKITAIAAGVSARETHLREMVAAAVMAALQSCSLSGEFLYRLKHFTPDGTSTDLSQFLAPRFAALRGQLSGVTPMQHALMMGKIATGASHAVGVRADTTVTVTGDGLDKKGKSYGSTRVGLWCGVSQICVSAFHTLALCTDGTVLAAGYNGNGQCDVDAWTDGAAVAVGLRHSVLLKQDGTALACGSNRSGQCEVGKWRGLTAIAAGGAHTLGLKQDGTVVACGETGLGRCAVESWQNVIAISAGAGGAHSAGLKQDGTVVCCGQNNLGQCDTELWHDIVAVAAGTLHTVGLCADGTVKVAGDHGRGQGKVLQWRNVVAIAAGRSTMALCADGSVLTAGGNEHGQDDTASWNLLLPADAARREAVLHFAVLKKAEDAKIAALRQEKEAVGTFAVAKRKAIDEKIKVIHKQILVLRSEAGLK
ncbi:MAG: hypothetical protein PHS97_02515 [Oscillospiraceae bacterium]|nr:hypothetical protein [Oscillospiraceae bacterium]